MTEPSTKYRGAQGQPVVLDTAATPGAPTERDGTLVIHPNMVIWALARGYIVRNRDN